MSLSVNFRGSKHGLSIKLASDVSYEEIKRDMAERFKGAEKFLGSEKIAVSFEGRELNEQQEEELVGIIQKNCGLEIVCIMEQKQERVQQFKQTVKQVQEEFDASICRFYKGQIRSGQCMEFSQSVIVLGDINPGATIISKGNIVILGSLRGTAVAGASGRKNSFIVAMDMHPIQLQIADILARSADKRDEKAAQEPRIAFVEDENIYIEPLSKSVLNDIIL